MLALLSLASLFYYYCLVVLVVATDAFASAVPLRISCAYEVVSVVVGPVFLSIMLFPLSVELFWHLSKVQCGKCFR